MVGFPHSEIIGSKLIRSSPTLIAAYYVLHRLCTPRHPLDALKTLDRSHYQCPQPLAPTLLKEGAGHRARTNFATPCGAAVLIGQIKKNHSSRTITVPPRGCRVKQTVMCLFTMSKDPVADTSQCQHNQTCSLSCDVFLGLGFGDHRATMVKWWSQTGSNRRHPACKAGALPAELWPHFLVNHHPRIIGWPGWTRTTDLTLIRRAL